MVDIVREHFPKVEIVARARNVARGSTTRRSEPRGRALNLERLLLSRGWHSPCTVTWHPMTTPADVRWLLGEAEAFLRAGDAYGAVSRGSAALRRAASIHSPEGAEVQHEAELAFERFQAAAEAMRANVERRNALHVANEHRAAGISA